MYWSIETIGQQAVAKLQSPSETISQQVVDQLGQIPWGHNLVIISKAKNQKEALFYTPKTMKNDWCRAVLNLQIELKAVKCKPEYARQLTKY
jgi:predicted nuclease of restriction endonuclease-like (RecB) superfamily